MAKVQPKNQSPRKARGDSSETKSSRTAEQRKWRRFRSLRFLWSDRTGYFFCFDGIRGCTGPRLRSWFSCYFCNEAIASSRQRLDVARMVGRIPQRVAKPQHRAVQAVIEVHKSVRRPELVA